MRVGIAVIVLLVAGIFLSAYLLIGDRTSSPLQRANVSGCSECHEEDKPVYNSVVTVHGKHVDQECAQCHVQLANVTGCADCHASGVPAYKTPLRVHRKHAALNCSRCHGESEDLKTANRLHRILEWSGVGIFLFALIGIMTNLLIVSRSGKGN